jgi:hypothetical protein
MEEIPECVSLVGFEIGLLRDIAHNTRVQICRLDESDVRFLFLILAVCARRTWLSRAHLQ